eukprot:358915-Chlamydomonas_euryale.AAC.3
MGNGTGFRLANVWERLAEAARVHGSSVERSRLPGMGNGTGSRLAKAGGRGWQRRPGYMAQSLGFQGFPRHVKGWFGDVQVQR